MTTIDANYPDAGTSTYSVTDFGDNRSMTVHITPEGIILDLYHVDEDGNDTLRESVGMTYDEWADWMEGK